MMYQERQRTIQLQGIEEGKIEGRKEGKIEGRKEAQIEGRKEGRKEAQIDTVKRMLAEKFPLELIVRISGLSLTEVG